jgi:hypothetical protein
MSGAAPGPVVHVNPMGGFANRMMQAMVAMTVASHVPGCVLSNIELPEWGLRFPAVPAGEARRRVLTDERLDLAHWVAQLASGTVERLEVQVYGQRLEYFLPPELYRQAFAAAAMPGEDEAPGFGPGQLVCSIRGGEVLDGRHPGYVLLPVEFYAELAARTGLAPVFLGQLEPNSYVAALRARFPGALFVDSRGPMADFAALRRSRNIVPSVSTFAWLAAWLSDADQVFLPVDGMLHPVMGPHANLLPLDDPRYRFFLFPANYAVPVEEHGPVHRALLGQWRLVEPAMLREMFRAVPRLPRRFDRIGPLFDEAFYLASHPDVRDAVAAGGYACGHEHYVAHGFVEKRVAVPIDAAWYARTYPLAAQEIGEGWYADPEHHYVEIGCARGYRAREA